MRGQTCKKYLSDRCQSDCITKRPEVLQPGFKDEQVDHWFVLKSITCDSHTKQCKTLQDHT